MTAETGAAEVPGAPRSRTAARTAARTAVLGVAVALLAAGGGVAGAGTTGGADHLRASGRFAPPRAFIPPVAFTYDQRLVPAGASITVRQRVDGAGTTVSVAVRKAAPRHTFGIHVHTRPCGADPDDAGPHYQNVPDPNPPSMDPAYANSANEIWLDFRTDRHGDARSRAWHPWTPRTGGAGSVVLHERATSTEPGEAGMAGARVACFTVPFMGAGRS